MLRWTRGFVFGVLLAILFHIWVFGWDIWSQTFSTTIGKLLNEHEVEEERGLSVPPLLVPPQEHQYSIEDSWVETEHQNLKIHMPVEQVREVLGDPVRIDQSAYGYDWWIYNENWQTYIQIGVKNGQVVTIYTNAPAWEWEGLSPGMRREDWIERWPEVLNHSFQYKFGFFTFELTDQEREEKPLHIEDGVAVQLYVDIHDEQKISALRLMDLETLLLHRPYALQYTGNLPEVPEWSEEEWSRIEEAYEQQILDVVNVTRTLFSLPQLEWDEDVAQVAKAHSLDMLRHDFFDHTSPNTGALGDRLGLHQVAFARAGENIAWNYVDGVDAHQGWLNSLGHRKNVMEASFQYLGVGVKEKYYTQNFISR